MKKMGIYAIKNTITNDMYIGHSTDIKARWSYHKCVLQKNKHKNYNLQRDYNKYGADCFEYIIIQECEKEQLLQLEIFYTKKFGTYNISIGNNHAEITKIKMSKPHKKILK